MTPTRTIFLLTSSLTAGCAFAAAYFWYRSSVPTMETPPEIAASIDDAPSQHILNTEADIYSLYAVLTKVSRLNKNAAIWSAFAAGFGAAAAFVSTMM
ncbi:MAG: hypothetical protein ABSD70_12985 [Terracidiphilus sp.]